LKVNNWISVKDELPERDENVLCYSDKNGGYHFIGYLGKHSGEWCKDGMLHCYNVLYWMPLTEPPIEKSK
jgi:hypothetical protein